MRTSFFLLSIWCHWGPRCQNTGSGLKSSFLDRSRRVQFFGQAFCVTEGQDVKKPRVVKRHFSGSISMSTSFVILPSIWCRWSRRRQKTVSGFKAVFWTDLEKYIIFLPSIWCHWSPICQKTAIGFKAVFWTDLNEYIIFYLPCIWCHWGPRCQKTGSGQKQFSGPISRSTFFCQAFCVTGAKDVKKPRVAYKQLSGPISISTYFFLKYLVWLKAKMSKKTRVGKKQFSLPISMRTSFFILSSICIHWGPRCQKTGSGQKVVFWTDI